MLLPSTLVIQGQSDQELQSFRIQGLPEIHRYNSNTYKKEEGKVLQML